MAGELEIYARRALANTNSLYGHRNTGYGNVNGQTAGRMRASLRALCFPANLRNYVPVAAAAATATVFPPRIILMGGAASCKATIADSCATQTAMHISHSARSLSARWAKFYRNWPAPERCWLYLGGGRWGGRNQVRTFGVLDLRAITFDPPTPLRLHSREFSFA